MHLVSHAANFDQMSCLSPDDASDIFIERFANSLSNQLETIFRTEYDVVGQIGVGGRGRPLNCRRRIRGLVTYGSILFHGPPPTAICWRDFAALVAS